MVNKLYPICSKLKEEVEKNKRVREAVIIAPRGAVTYGLFKEGISDVDYVVFYVPPFDSLLLDSVQAPKHCMVDGIDYVLEDVRLLSKRVSKANLTALDFLWGLEQEDSYVHPAFFKVEGSVIREMFDKFNSYLLTQKDKALASHIGQLADALKMVKEKKDSYTTRKRLVTAFYLANLLYTLIIHRDSMDLMKVDLKRYLGGKDVAGNIAVEPPDLLLVKFGMEEGEDELALLVERSVELKSRLEELEKNAKENTFAYNYLKFRLRNTLENSLSKYYGF